MKSKEAAAYAPNSPLLDSVSTLPETMHGAMHQKSVRKFSHDGHTISIVTSYQVKVDGRIVHLPLVVTEDGQVQSHVIPNYSLSSAVDIVKTIIDLFPNDFEKKSRGRRTGGQRGKHPQGHQH